MKPIIVIDLPLGMGIDREITEPYGYDLFYGDENIESQWKKLEELRETGGVIVVQPSHTSAVREILNPYIGEDGFIKECGLRKVHTEEHGDFCVILYHNPSEVMALRAFYYNSKKHGFARGAFPGYRAEGYGRNKDGHIQCLAENADQAGQYGSGLHPQRTGSDQRGDRRGQSSGSVSGRILRLL